MQTSRELRGIPPGSEIVLHLLRSAIGANPDHKRALASFGLLQVSSSGKRRGPGSSGHVGKAVRHTWRSDWASRRTQQLTRYMYVDPGDDVLNALGEGQPTHAGNRMKIERFRTSLDEPAALVLTDGDDGIRIESQPDGFGMMWPTELDVVSALEHALTALPAPESEDEAVVTGKEGPSRKLPVRELLHVLTTEESGQVSLVQLDIGSAALTWAQSTNGNAPPRRRMGFGDDYYIREQIAELLSKTACLPGESFLEDVLEVADETLEPQHTPPA